MLQLGLDEIVVQINQSQNYSSDEAQKQKDQQLQANIFGQRTFFLIDTLKIL